MCTKKTTLLLAESCKKIIQHFENAKPITVILKLCGVSDMS